MENPYSSDTLLCLRNCSLQDKGTIDGTTFVRCIPRATSYPFKLPVVEQRAYAVRIVAEINDPGVVVAQNDSFGGDYVRVSTDTAIYRLICRMKS